MVKAAAKKVGIDRSQKPRALRGRQDQRRVAEPGFLPDFAEVDPASLSENDLNEIATSLPSVADREWLDAALQDVAGSYRRWLSQPTPSREEARYQLRMMSHCTWRLEQPGSDEPLLKECLVTLLGELNPLAQTCLWPALTRESHGAIDDPVSYLQSPDRDWSTVGNAAAAAAAKFKGGDYKDLSLSFCLLNLARTFEAATAESASYSRKPTGEIGKEGRQQMIAGSPCGEFVLSFFARVDPTLEAAKVSNALDKVLAELRKGPSAR